MLLTMAVGSINPSYNTKSALGSELCPKPIQTRSKIVSVVIGCQLDLTVRPDFSAPPLDIEKSSEDAWHI